MSLNHTKSHRTLADGDAGNNYPERERHFYSERLLALLLSGACATHGSFNSAIGNQPKQGYKYIQCLRYP